ncbi:hypothetical protein ACKWTF_015465 [Chironomus riparius]
MDNTKKARTEDDHSLINILASTSIKIIDRHLLNVRKNQNINKESKGICKVLNITSDLNLEEVLTIVKSMNPKDYPKLFLFIINDQNSSKTEAGHESIKEHLLKFDDTRPQVLQLISEDNNLSTILYKIKPSSKFVKIEVKQDIETVKDFPSFLCTLINGNLQQAVFEVINNLTTLQDSPLILRFLRILDFGDEFFRILILKCAANGSKDDFIAALDAPFDAKEKSLLPDVQKFLSTAFYDEQSDDENSDDDATMKSSDDLSNKHPKSVLLTAVDHNNQEVIKYLINSRLNLIRNLPFDHQVRISTVAFETGQLDILCDLLDIADFPFPGYFKLDDSQTNERLLKTIAYRAELLACIRDEDFEKIDDVVKQNSNLRIAYSINNNSALKEAINSNKLGVYYFLKTFGYTGNDCNEFIEKLSDKEKNKAVRQAAVQKEAIYSNSLVYDQQAVLTLSSNSYIHNKTITKDQETEYFKKIRKWYKNINKVASDVLDVAATCDKLKIIYDFESETVENVSLAGPNSPGITFVSNKWIFIGAQISGRERELEITTTLGQQICYFVLHLVYNNGGRPYYKDDHHVEEIFDNIVKSIDQWSGQPSETIDDECFRLISSVFTSYSPKEFHAELILRVVNILIEFQADQTLSTHLQQKYKNLFSFWNDFVVPELKLYLKKDPKVVWLNGCINVHCRYRDMKIDLFAPKNFTEIFKNKIIIISTNVPSLLLIDIHRHLKRVHGCLIDTKNIFLDTKELKSDYVLNEFRQICRHYADMNVIVDCSSEKLTLTNLAFANKKNNFVFVVANETQKDEIVNVALKVCGVNPELLELNYNWFDLNTKSQKNLLKYKINFQNNDKLSLLEVLEGPNDRNVEDIREMYNSYSEVIDDQLLNFIIDGHKVVVDGIKDEDEMNDITFDYLFKNTKFIKKKQYEDIEKDKDAEVPQITADELIKITRNKKFVLISDKTGTGKSFALKNISKLIKDKYPTRWTSYIELRLFTKEIKKQKVQPELLTFLIEKILKLNLNFEVKIFQKLYKDGKVCLIFDEYDTIAPNYVEFVTKLIQEFQFNGGNQMFIGTRDYFEVNLQQKFQIDDIFKLGDFSNEYGYELIAKRWILNSNRDLTPKNFDELIKKSPKMEIYVKVAEKMIKKIQTINKQSKFVPRFYHMISEAFKDGRLVNIDVEDPTLSLNRFKIFRTVGIIFYKIWSRDKGEIRNDANISTQGFELNFWQIHQYLAIIIFFPELLEQIYPYYEPTEWIIEEIIACGMVGFKNGKYYFQNVDLRDFFLAEFITKELKRKRLGKIGLEIFVKVLTSSAHRGTQIIINDAVVLDPALLADHGKKFLEFANEFCKMDNLEDFYVNELECLVVMIVDILKSGKYDKVKELLTRTAGKLIKSVKSAEFYVKFEEFLFSFLKSKDLKTLIKEQEVLLRIVQSELDISIFESLVIKLESKFGREFIQKIFRTKSINLEGNILYMMCLSANKEQFKVLKFLETIQKYLTESEIIELMTNCNQNEENILQICVQNDDEDLLKDLWTKIENSFGPQLTKEFASKKSSKNQFNVLHYAAFNTNIEIHQTLWTLLVKSFKNLNKLKNLMLEMDHDGSNFLQLLVASNNSEVIEFHLKNLKENYSEAQYQEFLMQKDISGSNLLQIAAKSSKEVKTHQMLWNNLQDSYKSDLKFLEFLKENDNNGNNVFHLAASSASSDVFEFMIQELEKIVPKDEIKNLLRILNNFSQNLLQLAVKNNKTIELQVCLWKIVQKYFEKSEIFELIKNVDLAGNNLLSIVNQCDLKEIVELSLKEIERFSNQNW